PLNCLLPSRSRRMLQAGSAPPNGTRPEIATPQNQDQRSSARQAPPIPSITLPVPPQFSHGLLLIRPVPRQTGQTSSPVPGVPGGASSPGFMRVLSLSLATKLSPAVPFLPQSPPRPNRSDRKTGSAAVENSRVEWTTSCRNREAVCASAGCRSQELGPA